MGSWYGTCGVTRTAIHEGDPIVTVLLAHSGKEPEASTYSTAGHSWEPISGPIYGEYADMGRMDPDEEGLLQFDLWKRNNSHYKDMTWEELEKGLYNNDLRRKDIFGNEVLIGEMMIHRPVYQTILNNGLDDFRGQVSFNDLEKQASEFVRHIQKVVSESEDFMASFRLIPEDFEIRYVQDLNFASFPYFNFHSLRNVIVENEEGADHPVDLYINESIKMLILKHNLENMRIPYEPQCGGGSQTDEQDLVLKIHETVNELFELRNYEY